MPSHSPNIPSETTAPIRVSGWAWQIRFPAVCPNCLQAAHTPLTVAKTFLRFTNVDGTSSSGSGMNRRIPRYPYAASFRIPFCQACASVHAAETQHLTFSSYFKFALLLLTYAGPGLIALACAKLFGQGSLSFLLRGEWLGLAVISGVMLFAFSMGVWLIRAGWNASRHCLVLPRTSVTTAVDFTDDLSTGFEPVWREFVFRNARYAHLFAEANRHRIWQTDGPQARRAAGLDKLLRLVLLGMVLLVAGGCLWAWLRFR